MMKTLKFASIYSLVIFFVLIIVKFITSPKFVISIFEKGFWMGLGILITMIIIIFIITFLTGRIVCSLMEKSGLQPFAD